MVKGKLITLEGIDGSGKSTQQKHIAHWLECQGYDVVQGKEPTNGHWGKELKMLAEMRDLSPDKELELFILDRRDDVERNILPAIREGKIFLLDRYYHSSMAYQGARDFDMWNIMERNEKFAPRPDLTLILDILPSETFFRMQKRGKPLTYWEGQEFLKRVWLNYQKMKGRMDYVRMIEGWEDEKVVFENIKIHIEELLK